MAVLEVTGEAAEEAGIRIGHQASTVMECVDFATTNRAAGRGRRTGRQADLGDRSRGSHGTTAMDQPDGAEGE
jgi:hypothetical protein